MLISQLFAWITVLLMATEILKFPARISHSRKLNRVFHNIHIPCGIALLLVGLIHGILGGNLPDVSFADAVVAPELFTINWGTGCYFVAILLAVNYLLRKKIKKHWLPTHRVLTILMVVTLVFHLLDVGIGITDRLFPSKDETAGETSVSVLAPAATFSGATLQDGVYEGTAQGYRSKITVSVTVEDGVVTDIVVVSQNDTPRFFSAAQNIISAIVGQQSLEVDSVSGATISAEGIKNAVYNALQQAVADGELGIKNVQSSKQGKRH